MEKVNSLPFISGKVNNLSLVKSTNFYKVLIIRSIHKERMSLSHPVQWKVLNSKYISTNVGSLIRVLRTPRLEVNLTNPDLALVLFTSHAPVLLFLVQTSTIRPPATRPRAIRPLVLAIRPRDIIILGLVTTQGNNCIQQ